MIKKAILSFAILTSVISANAEIESKVCKGISQSVDADGEPSESVVVNMMILTDAFGGVQLRADGEIYQGQLQETEDGQLVQIRTADSKFNVEITEATVEKGNSDYEYIKMVTNEIGENGKPTGVKSEALLECQSY